MYVNSYSNLNLIIGLARFLRFLAAAGAVHETGKDQYVANHVTHNLSDRAVEAGISH